MISREGAKIVVKIFIMFKASVCNLKKKKKYLKGLLGYYFLNYWLFILLQLVRIVLVPVSHINYLSHQHKNDGLDTQEIASSNLQANVNFWVFLF